MRSVVFGKICQMARRDFQGNRTTAWAFIMSNSATSIRHGSCAERINETFRMVIGRTIRMELRFLRDSDSRSGGFYGC
jgi:hypothetical protein